MQGHLKKFGIIAALSVALVPAFVLAAEPKTLKELVILIVDVLNAGTEVMVALALVIFLYGAAYNMIKAGERGGGALRTYLVWGVLILFVMVSIWGILALLQDTLVGASRGSAPSGSAQTGSVF